MNSGLGLTTRPKITSVIITLEHLTVHQINDKDLFWRLANKQLVESYVDYDDFSLFLKPKDTKFLKCKLFEVASVSVMKFCTGCSAASKVSLAHFESCEKSPLVIQNMNSNCIDNIFRIASEPGLNLSRIGIEFEAYDFEGVQTHGNCLSRANFKINPTLSLSNNFRNISVQNILLDELVRGLPALVNCISKNKRNFVVVNLRFFPQSNIRGVHWEWQYDIQASSSLQNQEAFNFLTCDGVTQKTDFMGYLEPFDAQMWLGTIISLLIYSCLMAILVFRLPNTSFIDSCVSAFLMN
jgi:hypothetical protein